MKIIFVIQSLKHKAGTERVATTLANLFYEKLNMDILIVNRDTDYIDVAYPLNSNIRVIKLTGNPVCFFIKLQKTIFIESPDLVFVHNMGKLSLLSSLLIKIKFKLYSLEHVSNYKKGLLSRFLDKFFYSRIDKKIVLTNSDLDIYSKWTDNVVKINNLSPYPISSNKYNLFSKKIIAVGRLTKQKNFSALIEAWVLIYKKLPEWEIEIYGSGEEFELLENLITDKNLERISLNKPIDDMPSLYMGSSFLVMSSIYEGLPMVLIEAQAFMLPVISFNCPFGPEEIIVNNENGILVENQNIVKLSKAILYLAKDASIREDMAKKSAIYSARYSEDVILKEWHNLLYSEFSEI